MPHKDKSRNSKWRGKVTRNGHTKTKYFDTKAEASQWEADQERLPLEEFLSETRTVYSLAEWSEEYLDYSKDKFVTKTYKEKVLAFRELFKSVSPKLEPTQLHAGMVLKHFQRQAKERSGNAANKDRKDLIAAWNWAKKYLPGWPKENPFSITDRQTEEEFPRYIPPVDDFWKVYDSLEDGTQDKIMLLTYLHTAARRGELFILKWSDIDFIGKRVRLWTRKRRGGLQFDWIPMTAELLEALTWWHENRTFKESENVFLCESEAPFSQDTYGKPFVFRQRWLRSLCEKVSVQYFGLHAVRHLSASILDDAGYPITFIQALLRHKNANTTSKYLHRLRGMRMALDDAFKRKSRPPEDVPASPRERPKLVLVKKSA